MEFLKEEVEYAGDKTRGQGVQAGFKVFCQLMLQLYPNFNMGGLEAFITPKVVEEAVIKVEEEVVVAREATNANRGGAGVKTATLVRVPKVIEVKDADES